MFAYNVAHFVNKEEGQEEEGRKGERKTEKEKGEKRKTENTIYNKTFSHLWMVFQVFEGLGRQDATCNLV